ncbi:hypothetical protein [Streptomyces sp. NPDC059906]|uniref:hypothetical protein n=1 Tax=Streptomyces sp. NPDC059906 TaxID=3346997 RepID=UPI0036585BD9
MADKVNASGENRLPLQNAANPAGATATRTSRLRLQMWRWVFAPRTTWQARRLAVEFGPGMDTRTAWVMARLARRPDEFPLAMRHLDREENAS